MGNGRVNRDRQLKQKNHTKRTVDKAVICGR